jgi:type IV secretion system protein TrbJ
MNYKAPHSPEKPIRQRLLKLGLIGLLMLSSMVPAFAILGLGDIVFDPTSYAELVSQLAQMEQQYAQLVQTYQMVRSQYDQMIYMAKEVPVTMSQRYRALATPWHYASASDQYGNTSAWISAVNSGVGVHVGYQSAVEPLNPYGTGLGQVPADQVDRLKRTFGTVELADGANEMTMDTIGRLRANASAVEAAIQNLEEDSLSKDPDMNTEIGVLNKINAANMVSVRNTQDTNKLLVTLAEQRLIDAQREREAEARAINNHTLFLAEGRAILDAQAAGSSAAMLAWRMP